MPDAGRRRTVPVEWKRTFPYGQRKPPSPPRPLVAKIAEMAAQIHGSALTQGKHRFQISPRRESFRRQRLREKYRLRDNASAPCEYLRDTFSVPHIRHLENRVLQGRHNLPVVGQHQVRTAFLHQRFHIPIPDQDRLSTPVSTGHDQRPVWLRRRICSGLQGNSTPIRSLPPQTSEQNPASFSAAQRAGPKNTEAPPPARRSHSTPAPPPHPRT